MNRDLPIIFSGHMVRALLEGHKTQTRRLAWRFVDAVAPDGEDGLLKAPTPWQKVKPGDRLWVRESYRISNRWNDKRIVALPPRTMTVLFVAGGEISNTAAGRWEPSEGGGETPNWAGKVRSAFHLPRWASRLTLAVTAVKVERLQAMCEADCIAEGADIVRLDGNPVDDGPMVRLGPSHVYGTPRTWFRELWNTLHGPAAWDENPDVVVITFTVHQQNIDALRAAA